MDNLEVNKKDGSKKSSCTDVTSETEVVGSGSSYPIQIQQELSEVKGEIAETKADLKDAKKNNDRDLILMYGKNLAELLKKENLLLAQQQQSAQISATATGPADSDEIEYKHFPLYFDVLKKVGLQTPYEQYTLYGSIGAFIYGAYSPIQKAYYLNKWLHETDPSFKDIWAAKANLSSAEQQGGRRYLEELKKVPRRYAAIPLSFLLIESIRFSYREMSGAFSAGKK